MKKERVILVSARSSSLSQIQIKEVLSALHVFHPNIIFEPILVQTTGDRDISTSLRHMGKSDFFTKEIDTLVLKGACDIGIHSAKDLPNPLPEGLQVIALTKGLDPSDVLVLRHGESLDSLPTDAVIATSSERREAAVRGMRKDLRFIDLRGTIEQRLTKLDTNEADGVVVAEAALIRLGLTHLNRIRIPGETAENQGRLAIVSRKGDTSMAELFKCLDTRKTKRNVLYLGLNPPSSLKQSYNIIHYPVIKIEPFPITNLDILSTFLKLPQFTHIIFTSQTAVDLFIRNKQALYGACDILINKRIFAIGQNTATKLKFEGIPVHKIAESETSEGIVDLLEDEDLKNAKILWPHSALSRHVITDYLEENSIPYAECQLYTTVPQKLKPDPDLKAIDEIIFTSPSTVDNFFQIYHDIPEDIQITTIGPITQARLDEVKNYVYKI